jgi:hypothetical protein
MRREGGFGGLYDLGNIYLKRQKYREAIECFEPLISESSRGLSFVPQLLAEAHIGVGDEAKALGVLNRLGMSPERITAEMDHLRANVSRRNLR